MSGLHRSHASRSPAVQPSSERRPTSPHRRAARFLQGASALAARGEAVRNPQADRRERRQRHRAPRIDVEHEMALRELAERRGARAVARIRLQPRELAAQHALHARGPRPEAELVVEPPRAGLDTVVVALAELVGVEGERLGAEHVVQHREHPRHGVCDLAAAEGREGVIGERRGAPGEIDLEVGDRHAVPQRERAVGRGHDRAPLGHDPVQREGEPVAVVDEPRVARIAVREAVDVALPRRHRRAPEVDRAAPRLQREPLDGARSRGGARRGDPDARDAAADQGMRPARKRASRACGPACPRRARARSSRRSRRRTPRA